MVSRGLKFLEAHGASIPVGSGEDGGVLWLVGYTLVKCEQDASHPLVAAGIKLIQDKRAAGVAISDLKGIYPTAVAVMFLCEVDPVAYRADIQYCLDQLLKRQQATGAWTYPPTPQMGDTSQTQYAVLAMWSADHAGFDVPTDAIERACNWLLRTQDLGGGWAYNGSDGGARTRQGGVTTSLTAAGLASIYVCGDMLLGGKGDKADTPDDNGGLAPALKTAKEVKKDPKKPAKAARNSRIDAAALRRGMSDGQAYFSQNTQGALIWQLVYLYAMERYHSFREVAENRVEKEPAWYNDGVDYLKSKQEAKGNWARDHDEYASTCFAILFLIRSTKKAIGKVVNTEGALLGGRGLPKDVTNVKMKGNQIVGAQAAKSIDDLLALLEGADDEKLAEAIEGASFLPLGDDATTRAKQSERLRKIVSLPSYQARILAVKALAKVRDLENVPVLIYALGDPDWRVAKEARDGLRLISRRFDGFGMPDKSTAAQRTAAQLNWKQWYKSIRPEAEFLD